MKKLIAFVSILFFLGGLGACRRGRNFSGQADAPATGQSDPEAAKREARSLIDRGKEFYKEDLDGEAAGAFEQAVKLDPESAEARYRLGLAYSALDREDEAKESLKRSIELYKKTIESDPNDAEAFFNLGEAYSVLHQEEEAARAYRQAIRLKPDHEEAYYQLGMSQTRLARYDEASTSFQKALELDPNDYRVNDALDNAREGVKRIKEGKKHQAELLKKQQEEEANKNANANGAATPAPKPRSKPHP
jgi:tetratricopeptide (TPR) repeat protein